MVNRRRPAPNAPGGSFGDIVSDLFSEGHINGRQFKAGVALESAWRAYHGRSEGLVGSTTEKVQTAARERICPPGGPRGIVEFDRKLNRLRPHERRLLEYMIRCRELPRGSLADAGRMRSAYTKRETARAVMVGCIGSLLNTLAEEFLGPERV